MTESVKSKFWVVMPAAGSGRRMRETIPKQYLSINGSAVIEHAIKVFLKNLEIEKIMVSLAKDDQRFSQLRIANDRRVKTTTGGNSRAQSVLNGLNALSAMDDDWVLVHDAARPCLSAVLLAKLIDCLRDDQVGGILAVPAKDTLKRATADQTISSTVDRADIWQAQTPQMFRYGLLKAALTTAIEQGVETTDEASSLEYCGYQAKLIEGDSRNLKITTPEDFAIAEFLLNTKQPKANKVQ
ncbi:MAG: 2-C-methyl-D-erythritol 4-phosphate cytidylyltransferase [Arenicella sp.]|jgi:2-C-methyl-D-erythritol 4-phosphate cytidylyltransferase